MVLPTVTLGASVVVAVVVLDAALTLQLNQSSQSDLPVYSYLDNHGQVVYLLAVKSSGTLIGWELTGDLF